MATYGGFAPGSYNAWALNLITDLFCSPGVARGMQVTAPGGMAVTLGVDPTALDGVVILPNGGWVRIDQAITYTVPANNGSGTRTDAIIAFLDPTGVANPEFSLTYNANWVGGFTGGNGNQQVIALISVSVGAVSISAGNITKNPNGAIFGNQVALLANNTASGEGVQVTEAFGQLSLVPYNTPAGQARDLVIAAVNAAGTKSNWTFNSGGSLIVPGNIQPVVAGVVGAGIRLSDNSSSGQTFITSTIATPGFRSLIMQSVNSAGGTNNFIFDPTGILQTPGRFTWRGTIGGSNQIVLHISPTDSTAGTYGLNYNVDNSLNIFNYSSSVNLLRIDTSGNLTMAGHVFDGAFGGTPVTLSGNTVAVRIFTGTTQPTNATNGDIWINA